MHIVKLLSRHFPTHKRSVTALMAFISLSLLLLGLGWMLFQ